MTMIYIWEGCSSNPGSDTSSLEWGFLWFWKYLVHGYGRFLFRI